MLGSVTKTASTPRPTSAARSRHGWAPTDSAAVFAASATVSATPTMSTRLSRERACRCRRPMAPAPIRPTFTPIGVCDPSRLWFASGGGYWAFDCKAPPGLRGLLHEVTHDSAPVPVFKRRSVRLDAALPRNGREEMMQLMHKRVFPAQDVTRGPPCPSIRVSRLGHEHRAKPVGTVVTEIEVQFIQAFHVQGQRARGAADFEREEILSPGAERAGFQRAHCAVGELDDRFDGILDVDGRLAALRPTAPIDEDAGGGGYPGDLADEKPRQVNAMGGKVANYPAAGARFAVPPAVGDLGINHRVVQVATPEVIDAAQPPLADHLPGELHRWVEAIAVAGHVYDVGTDRRIAHPRGLGTTSGKRFFAQHWQAARGRRQGGLGVHIIGSGVDQDLHAVIGDEAAPVGVGGQGTVPLTRFLERFSRTPCEGDQLRADRQRPEDRRDSLEREQMGLGGASVAEDANPERALLDTAHSTARATFWMPVTISPRSCSVNRGWTSRCTARLRIASLRGN